MQARQDRACEPDYTGAMPSRHLRLTFPTDQVTEPVTYHLAVDYGVVPNIRRAAIENHFGWMVVELTGTPEQLAVAEAYLTGLGVEISRAEGDVVAG
jgi:ABC-type methionine transport system ATPase subunit